MSDRYRNPLRKPRAFTLIEMLVVIAIIGVLLAILLPAINMVREVSGRTVCLSHMRQLSMSVITYSATNDGVIVPSARNGNLQLRYPGNTDKFLGGPPWYELLKESDLLNYKSQEKGDGLDGHAADAGILHCPSDKRDKGFASYSGNRYLMGFSGHGLGNGNGYDKWPMRKMSSLRGDLSNLILLGERGALEQEDWAKVGGAWSMGGASVTIFGGFQQIDSVGFYLGRHGNPKIAKEKNIINEAKVPFALADGHVEVFNGQVDCDKIIDGNPEGLDLDGAIVTDSPGKTWPKLWDRKVQK